MKNKIITIIGGSGFIGVHLAKKLIATGAFIKIVARHPERAMAVKIAGNVGQVCFCYADIKDPLQLKKAIVGSDVVINLAHNMINQKNNSFAAVNRDAAVNIARIVKRENIKQHIHFSALGVNRAYESDYARSKYDAEREVRVINPSAIIIRPALVYGSGDCFLSALAKLVKYCGIMPYLQGCHKKIQLLCVDDLVHAVEKIILADNKYNGSIFELAENHSHSLISILRYMTKALQLRAFFVPVPEMMARFFLRIGQVVAHLPITCEHIKLLHYENIIHKEDKMLYLNTLDIRARKYEDVLPLYLKWLRN